MADFDTITIEEATERLIDYRGKTPPKTDSGVRLITAKVVKGGQILNEPAEYIAADFYEEWMRRGLPQKHDVLLTTEAPLGEVAILRHEERVALAQRIILLRAKPKLIDPYFLFYALQSEFGQGELKARASGTTVLGIKQSELRQVRIPLFSLKTQQRIGAILSAYDELIENSQRRIRILETIARALYREWFVHFRFPGHEDHPRVASPFGEIPAGWEVRTVKDVATVTYGFPFASKKFSTDGIGTPVIRIRDILDGSINTFTDEAADPKYHIKNGAFLSAWTATFTCASGRAATLSKTNESPSSNPTVKSETTTCSSLWSHRFGLGTSPSSAQRSHISATCTSRRFRLPGRPQTFWRRQERFLNRCRSKSSP